MLRVAIYSVSVQVVIVEPIVSKRSKAGFVPVKGPAVYPGAFYVRLEVFSDPSLLKSCFLSWWFNLLPVGRRTWLNLRTSTSPCPDSTGKLRRPKSRVHFIPLVENSVWQRRLWRHVRGTLFGHTKSTSSQRKEYMTRPRRIFLVLLWFLRSPWCG